MKVKVLSFRYDDGSGYKIVRVYAETHFEQAEKDLEMLQYYASDSGDWRLDEVDFVS